MLLLAFLIHPLIPILTTVKVFLLQSIFFSGGPCQEIFIVMLAGGPYLGLLAVKSAYASKNYTLDFLENI
jgi:hypothetical protein